MLIREHRHKIEGNRYCNYLINKEDKIYFEKTLTKGSLCARIRTLGLMKKNIRGEQGDKSLDKED